MNSDVGIIDIRKSKNVVVTLIYRIRIADNNFVVYDLVSCAEVYNRSLNAHRIGN